MDKMEPDVAKDSVVGSPITKRAVFLYYADQLSRERRIELEQATEQNPQVKRWFEELAPTPGEFESTGLPSSGTRSRESSSAGKLSEIKMEDVLCYVLGRIHDPARRQQIEATKDTKPELWNSFLIQTALETQNDELGPDLTEEQVPDEIAKYYDNRRKHRK